MTDFAGLLRALSDAGVEFIIVGGAAATAHGAARLTVDLDIVYARNAENVSRLVRALQSHQPYPVERLRDFLFDGTRKQSAEV